MDIAATSLLMVPLLNRVPKWPIIAMISAQRPHYSRGDFMLPMARRRIASFTRIAGGEEGLSSEN